MGVGGSRKSGGWWICDDKALEKSLWLSTTKIALLITLLLAEWTFAFRILVSEQSNQRFYLSGSRDSSMNLTAIPWSHTITLVIIKTKSIITVIAPLSAISCLSLHGLQGQSQAGPVMFTSDRKPDPNPFKNGLLQYDSVSEALQLVRSVFVLYSNLQITPTL